MITIQLLAISSLSSTLNGLEVDDSSFIEIIEMWLLMPICLSAAEILLFSSGYSIVSYYRDIILYVL